MPGGGEVVKSASSWARLVREWADGRKDESHTFDIRLVAAMMADL